ncbi:hypothetical protein NPX13_g8724 [Xylaria arbuscula]|uniref:Catechol dioxygenase N-terminal domain-containing protein n=1 Tax=Xylaria arbuscula TaxID=114810 RepID=A0A9W8N858_9PEZI|nr:hypothetical protein NPX13_g8724 [Xylaria arbuscula]
MSSLPSNTGVSNAAQAPQSSRFDPTFTQHCLDTMGTNVTPRNRQVLGALIRHIHDFSREVELTIDEWMAGVRFVNELGKIYVESGKTRNETHRISDILGLETLVDEIAHKIVSDTGVDPTSSAILGPFWSPNAPFRENGGTIIQNPAPTGRVTHENYKGCTTQLYPKDDPWLATDTVFAVKDDLVVDFKPLQGDDKAELELEYNVILAPKDYKGKEF